MKSRIHAAAAAADAFGERWSTKAIGAIEPAEHAELLRERGELRAARSEVEQWMLMLARTESDDPTVADLQAWVDALLPRLDEALRHFELKDIRNPTLIRGTLHRSSYGQPLTGTATLSGRSTSQFFGVIRPLLRSEDPWAGEHSADAAGRVVLDPAP